MNIAKPGETEEMYRKNLALLPQWLREAILKVPDEEMKKNVEVVFNGEGYPVCRYQRDGVQFHITSEHPLREAKAWGESIKMRDAAEIILYGTGFGYSLFELFARKLPQALVIVFEEDLCLFQAMLHYFDLSPLVQTGKIVFLVGDSDRFQGIFLELCCSKLFFFSANPAVLFTFPATRNFKKEYLEIHRFIFKKLTYITSIIGNSHQDDLRGLHNLLGNAKTILQSPYLSSLKGKCRGVPAVIVSNGPSLDRSIPLLKEIQGKCLMICSESAIVPLTKHGIQPDILAVLERTKENYLYHFKNQNYSADISLFALAMADPRIFSSFAGEKVPIFRQGEELNCWFNRHLGDGNGLNAGSSVAHLAVSIALYLGADPIIFVGQDFAYGPGNATHGKDAFVSEENKRQINDAIHAIPTVYVEGNSGEMIPSNQLWVNFRIGMENIIAASPEHHFYNATEGGAKIKGTEWVEFSRLIQRYCTEPIPFRISKLVAESREKVVSAEREAKLKEMTADVRRYAELFQRRARELNLQEMECNRMMFLCSGNDEEKYRNILDETYRKDIAVFYRSEKESLFSFFFQRIFCAYFYLFNGLGAVDSKEKRVEIFNLHRQLFQDLRVICQSLTVTFEEAAQPLETVAEELTEQEKAV